MATTSNGDLRCTRGPDQIDVVRLNNYGIAKRHNEPPTLSSYLKLVPLTIQSIAYDLGRGVVVGEKGIQSILSGVVKVNNQKTIQFAANRMNTTSRGYAIKKLEDIVGLEIDF